MFYCMTLHVSKSSEFCEGPSSHEINLRHKKRLNFFLTTFKDFIFVSCKLIIRTIKYYFSHEPVKHMCLALLHFKTIFPPRKSGPPDIVCPANQNRVFSFVRKLFRIREETVCEISIQERIWKTPFA